MSKREEAKGYIVLDRGRATQESQSEISRGVLFLKSFRRSATLFPTRARAQRSIDRTIQYAIEHELDWDHRGFEIIPIRGTAITQEDA